MARYGQAFKNKVLAKLLPPNTASLEEVSREVGTMQGRSTFEFVGESMHAWLAGRAPPSWVPEHIHLHPSACA